MPVVSAIIPAYNGAERYLAQAIESVLSQTFTDIEVIVIDDASTDNTESVGCKYPKIKYNRRAANGGQAVARNDGARLATGEFLAFLDQDDLWEPEKLNYEVQSARIHPQAGIIFCDGFMIDEKNNIMSYDSAIKPGSNIPRGLIGGYDIGNCRSLIRKTCFDEIGGYDENLFIWEDIDLSIRLYSRFPVVHIPKPLHRHRVYSNNVSRTIPSQSTLLSRQYFLEKHMSLNNPGSLGYKSLLREWANLLGDMGKYKLHQRDWIAASRCFWKSLRYNPFSFKTYSRLIRTYLSAISNLHRVQTRVK